MLFRPACRATCMNPIYFNTESIWESQDQYERNRVDTEKTGPLLKELLSFKQLSGILEKFCSEFWNHLISNTLILNFRRHRA